MSEKTLWDYLFNSISESGSAQVVTSSDTNTSGYLDTHPSQEFSSPQSTDKRLTAKKTSTEYAADTYAADIYRDVLKKYKESVEKQKELESKIDELNKKIKKTTQTIDRVKSKMARNVETLGLFASLMALLLINANIINSAKTFLGAILLVSSLSCTVILFAAVIHHFFNADDDNSSIHPSFYFSISIIGALIVIGILTYSFDKDIYSQNTEYKTEDSKKDKGETYNIKTQQFNQIKAVARPN